MRLSSYIKVFANKTKSEVMNLYKSNRITVNDEIKSLAYIVKQYDIVKVDDTIINRFHFSYYLYYKPIGILSDIKDTSDSYINNISIKEKVMPCGRLDKNSEGLMILTNDGEFINRICNPSSHEKKVYIVTLENIITKEFMENIIKPVVLDNKLTKDFEVKQIDNFNLEMVLSEGIYRQIRRMVKLSNNKVKNLKRIKIGNYELKDMKPGEIKKINF